MQLIYRARQFEYTRTAHCSIYQPNAVNWRYQVLRLAVSHPAVMPSRDRQPRAINWRYQMAVEA
jgi:hypothetical protein